MGVSDQDLAACRILVCEDDPVQARVLSARILARGFEVLGPYASADLASRAARKGAVRAALLDVSLSGGSVAGAALALAEQGIPFAFISACGAGADPTLAGFPGALVVPKPVTAAVIDEILDALVGKGANAA